MNSRLKVAFTLILFIMSVSLFADTTNILFIGNSYTSYNNLPNLVTQVAFTAGDTIYTESHTPGGRRISQHAADAQVFSRIRSREWDYVVIQCQSQEPSFPDGQVATDVFPHAKTLCDSIRAISACTIPMFYMTWGRKNGDASNCAFFPPLCTYEGMDSILRSNYLKMGEQNDAEVAGVGAVWRELRIKTPSLELYTADESHPSYAGSLAAAYTFYSSVFRKSPFDASYKGSLSQMYLDSIQEAVKVQIFDNLRDFNIEDTSDLGVITFIKDGCSYVFDGPAGFETYSWDFGDGSTSNIEDPTHEYTTHGSYNVKLIGVDRCGKIYKASESISCELNSISSLQNEKAFVYPNPSSGSFYIMGNMKLESIHLLDGKKIDYTQKGKSYSVSDEVTGILLLSLSDGDHLFYQRILVE